MSSRFGSSSAFLALIAMSGACLLYFVGEVTVAAIITGIAALLLIAAISPSGTSSNYRRNKIPFGPLTWKLEDFVRHWLIVGRSGCGKTLAAMKTLAISFYRSVPEAGGLVIDQKGDFAQMFANIMKGIGSSEKTFLLRCPPPEDRHVEPAVVMNLIGNTSISWADYADLIVTVAISQGQKTSNEFFKFQARDAIHDALLTLEMSDVPVTLVHVYEFLTHKEDQQTVFESVEATEEHYSEIYAKLAQVPIEDRTPEHDIKMADAHTRKETAQRMLARWASFYSGYQGQFEGVLGQAQNYLRPYATAGLEKTFSAGFRKDAVNLFKAFDEGKIVAPSIPQSYGAARGYVMAFFKILYYTYGLRRFDRADRGEPMGVPCILWIDEAQNSLLRSEEGLSDISALDKLRAANCGVVFAMQCYTSAIPPLETEAKADVLFTNLNNHVVFSLNLEKGRKIAADNIGEDEIRESSYSYDRGHRRSTQHSRRRKHILPPIFFRRLPKFKAVIIHTEGKHAIATLPPLTDDGKHVEKWFLWAYIKSILFSW